MRNGRPALPLPHAILAEVSPMSHLHSLKGLFAQHEPFAWRIQKPTPSGALSFSTTPESSVWVGFDIWVNFSDSLQAWMPSGSEKAGSLLRKNLPRYQSQPNPSD